MKLHKHQHLPAHHRYQLEVFFLFVVSFFLVIPFWMILDAYGLDIRRWEWAFFWSWLVLYVGYSLWMRSKISRDERINPLKRPIAHWVLLGITLIAIHLQPTDLQQMQILDPMFAVFSIFLADSFWDFKKIKLFRTKR